MFFFFTKFVPLLSERDRKTVLSFHVINISKKKKKRIKSLEELKYFLSI